MFALCLVACLLALSRLVSCPIRSIACSLTQSHASCNGRTFNGSFVYIYISITSYILSIQLSSSVCMRHIRSRHGRHLCIVRVFPHELKRERCCFYCCCYFCWFVVRFFVSNKRTHTQTHAHTDSVLVLLLVSRLLSRFFSRSPFLSTFHCISLSLSCSLCAACY